MELVIATGNTNKVREIQDKFHDIEGLALIPLSVIKNPPDVVEDGATFHENALKKATVISGFTGQAALADDSGIVIDALGGRPGIYSARYGGENLSDRDRNLLILEEMRGIPPGKRSARFVCVIAIAMPGGASYHAVGECSGFISDSLRGANGFGYDPIFYMPGRGKTMAELSLNEKNSISHRAKALESAKEILVSLCNKP
jgi:XTP/dITP diphosphohydrolase